MKCPRCHAENPGGMRFCGQCAAPLGEPAKPRFGSPESYTPKHLAEKILISKSALEGERKPVTVLFCDIANSTALAERLGPARRRTRDVRAGRPRRSQHRDGGRRQDRIIVQRSVRANQVAFCENALAEGYLAVAERDGSAGRAGAMKKAKRACGAALRQGTIFRAGLPAATRLRGRYEWLRGKRSVANTWWGRSVAVAEQLGAQYDLGLTCLEIGERTRQRASLARAEAIFAEIGARLDLAEARSATRALEAGRRGEPG